jgi:hypothetical protein
MDNAIIEAHEPHNYDYLVSKSKTVPTIHAHGKQVQKSAMSIKIRRQASLQDGNCYCV